MLLFRAAVVFSFHQGYFQTWIHTNQVVALLCRPSLPVENLNKVGDIKTARVRKNVVIFVVVGLLHAPHEVQSASEVCNGFKAVIKHLQNDSFAELLVSHEDKHKLPGENVFRGPGW